MPRLTTRPADTVREEIRRIDEVPATPMQAGFVRVLVGLLDEAGEFIVPQQFVSHTIEGENYAALIGPPTDANPNKPAGTYRNDDLWQHIEVAKVEVQERVAAAKEKQADKERAQAAEVEREAQRVAAEAALVKEREAATAVINDAEPQNPV